MWDALEQFAFQVVPPCGGHRSKVCASSLMPRFQVVPPCGGHLAQWPRRFGLRCFKSCPRVGGIKYG